MSDEKWRGQKPDEALEEAPCSVVEPASGHMTLTETSGIWSVFAAYFPPKAGSESQSSLSCDEEDFSSEFGYEPGFEGRSEFEYGEFERWV